MKVNNMSEVDKKPYPDFELITRLLSKMRAHSITSLTTGETVDLINHLNEALFQEIKASKERENQAKGKAEPLSQHGLTPDTTGGVTNEAYLMTSGKQMVLPYFCPLSPDTDADRLAKGMAGYLASEGVEDIAALPVSIGILAAVQTFALRGADAACDYLAKRAAPYRQNKGVTGDGGVQ
jgi:hypothetical protein